MTGYQGLSGCTGVQGIEPCGTGCTGIAGVQGTTGSGPGEAAIAFYALKYVLENSPELRKLFDKYGVDPSVDKMEHSTGGKNFIMDKDFDDIPEEYLPLLIGIHGYIDEIIEKRLHKKEQK